MGSGLGHAEAFPKRAKATQCLVPYSENKGYASNPRRFHSHLRHISNYSHKKKKKKKKNDLGPSSFLFKLLDGADGVYGWLHPKVSDRRRDTPRDNERNDHLEKSEDESELRLGV